MDTTVWDTVDTTDTPIEVIMADTGNVKPRLNPLLPPTPKLMLPLMLTTDTTVTVWDTVDTMVYYGYPYGRYGYRYWKRDAEAEAEPEADAAADAWYGYYGHPYRYGGYYGLGYRGYYGYPYRYGYYGRWW